MPNVLLHGCLMIALVCSSNLQVWVTGCETTLLAKKRNLSEPEGGSISLQCEVNHCGREDWKGGWGTTVSGYYKSLHPSPRLYLSNYTISVNRTGLLLKIHNLNQSDSGGYQCQIEWMDGVSNMGSITYINVTTGSYQITESIREERKISHRLLIYAGASLCFLLVLGLACCLSSKHAPPIPPHFRGTSTARVKPKAEVVYAAVVLKKPRQQKEPQMAEPTVYSTLSFSAV